MAANRTYKLPWQRLDQGKIVEATLVVADSIPKVKVEVEAKCPTSVRGYFAIPRNVALPWEDAELERRA